MAILRAVLILTVFLLAFLAAVATYLLPVAGLLFAALACAIAREGRHRSSAEFGTARWAAAADIPHLFDGSGVILGHIPGRIGRWEGLAGLFDRRLPAERAVRAFLASLKRNPPSRLVRLTDGVHVSVFAPTGAGKGVSIILPFLLDSRESFLVVDVKGELAHLTAAHRAAAFGQEVVRIDPFGLATDAPATFNPLDGIDPDDPESLDQARAVAEAIVVQDVGARDPHWTQKAATTIAGAILAVVNFCPKDRRSLQEVAEIMADKALLGGAIRALKASPAHGGLLARVGGEMALSADRELDGILSTANRSLAFLGSPAVALSTRGTSSFDPSELGGRRGMTVYLILPAKYLRSHAGLLRLWVSALMRSVVDRGVRAARPVNVVLDEAAALGHLEVIDDMLTMGRGYGLKILAVYQSLAQLRKVFPDGQDGVLLGNTTQVFFAANDKATADYVSDRLGEWTQTLASGGSSRGSSRQESPQGSNAGSSWGTNASWQLGGRWLLRPEEVVRLDPRVAVTFHRNLPPLATYLTRHYEESGNEPPGAGMFRVAADVAGLFVPALILAALFAVGLVRQFK